MHYQIHLMISGTKTKRHHTKFFKKQKKSQIRQVPDNQEAFIEVDTDRSLISMFLKKYYYYYCVYCICDKTQKTQTKKNSNFKNVSQYDFLFFTIIANVLLFSNTT